MLIEVAIPAPLPQTFSYSSDAEIPPGCRVLVPFGRREVVGVSLGRGQDIEITDNNKSEAYAIKPVKSVIDTVPVYSPVLLDLARWMAQYYFCSVGDVLRTMLPAAGGKKKRVAYELTEAGVAVIALQEGIGGQLRQLFGSKRSLLQKTIDAKLERLLAENPLFPSLRQLMRQQFLREIKESTMTSRQTHAPEPEDELPISTAAVSWPTLTPPQEEVLQTMLVAGVDVPTPAKPFLLWGVTGAGKTEVYLRLIQAMLHKTETTQALVLVPEISLTPQMTRIFMRRFPGLVAVVHSAMTDTDRWTQLERIRSGAARILIGPRSAVFGPFRDLKLLIVDEEHDSSYKQNTGVTYHGRDIAIMRARMEGACVVLGSATPSLESFYNARQGKYELLRLAERATGALLPTMEVIEQKAAHTIATKVTNAGTVGRAIEPTEIPIADAVIEALRTNKQQNLQSIVIVNRRGFAYYLLSLEQRKAVACPNCSISLTLHARSTLLRCHYCEYATDIAQIMTQYPGEHFAAVGYGSERAEEYLQTQLPEISIDRLDSDVLSTGRHKLDEILSRFRDGASHLLVGTQILAKGHDFPKVTVIALLEVDQLLNFPDFRAGERVFQLIVQAAGRAGRADHPGRVLIQTQRAAHPVIAAAIAQDFEQFAVRELEFRKLHHFPPFSRLIAVEVNGADRGQLTKFADRIDAWLQQFQQIHPQVFAGVRISGPMVPPLETIRGRHRRTLVFSASEVGRLREIVRAFQLTFAKTPGDIRLKIEVDPQSLL